MNKNLSYNRTKAYFETLPLGKLCLNTQRKQMYFINNPSTILKQRQKNTKNLPNDDDSK